MLLMAVSSLNMLVAGYHTTGFYGAFIFCSRRVFPMIAAKRTWCRNGVFIIINLYSSIRLVFFSTIPYSFIFIVFKQYLLIVWSQFLTSCFV